MLVVVFIHQIRLYIFILIFKQLCALRTFSLHHFLRHLIASFSLTPLT
jgi:hypothetical protein